MIEVKPNLYNAFVCPECKTEHPNILDILIEGVHVMGDCICSVCGFEFYQLFPVGTTVDFPLAYGKANGLLYDEVHAWVSIGLLEYIKTVRGRDIAIEKIVHKECKQVVILNALDFLYGHSLLKLLNVQYHLDHQKELGVVVIIPKILRWLVPKGCSEIWVVDVQLSELTYRQLAINNFISKELKRFDEVYLSRAYSHPDFRFVDISRFTGVVPFDIAKFSRVPIHITFVLREDRWWLIRAENFLMYRVLRRLGLRQAGTRFLVHHQNRLVKKTIRHIKRELPDSKFAIAGLGNSGDFTGYAEDWRRKKIDASTEAEWCSLYAKSQVVFGVHGSNMLLPSSLAAGCVEILPEGRYANIVQDLAVRYADRRQLYFYRFLPQYSKPRAVAMNIAAMITYYDKFNANMCVNNYREPMMDIKDCDDKSHRQIA